jgi:hypothetical protein
VSGDSPVRPPSAPAPQPAAWPPGGASQPPTVEFEQRGDGAWVRWSVVEVDAAGVPGARGPRCLLFRRDDCIRRVWDYPPDWCDLDPAALAALSWRR